MTIDDMSLEDQLRRSLHEVAEKKSLAKVVDLHAMARRAADPALVERVVITGNLAELSAKDRVNYYRAICESVGLNPLTRPFDYLQLGGRLVLYANKGCSDQLRSIHGVSVQVIDRKYEPDLGIYTVTARATKPDGRCDEDVGSVQCKNLHGEALANATMKAHTKAKRRVTLSICGLSFLDESEVEAVPQAKRVQVDPETGEVLDALPRISPHGEDEPGKVYRTIEDEDRAIMAIQDAADINELKDALHSLAWETPDDLENWSAESKKRISAAYRRRERQIEKEPKL